jgi:hypothetical protein
VRHEILRVAYQFGWVALIKRAGHGGRLGAGCGMWDAGYGI